MTKKIAWFFLGLLFSLAGVALAASVGTIRIATGILVGDANSNVTRPAAAADVNSLYNGFDFRSGQNVTNCNLVSSPLVGCSETNGRVPIIGVHSRVGNASQTVAGFTNLADSDFNIILSEVGATNKFARVGPSVNIPLKISSRASAQEILKSAAVVITTDGNSLGYNYTSCARVQTGITSCNIAAAGFTNTPICACSIQSSGGQCSIGPATFNSVQIGVRNSSGALTDGLIANMVCIGI